MSIFSWISYNRYMFFFQLIAKLVALFSWHFLRRGGSTWPGEIALKLKPDLIKQLRPLFKEVVVITGTNGKTSTSQFLVKLLKRNKLTVISNPSGANLANGVLSSLLVKLPFFAKGEQYIAVLEMDEYAFAEIASNLKPSYVVLLNLFRDQLDRYGEVTNILNRWQKALSKLPESVIIYLTFDPGLQSLFLQLENRRQAYQIPSSLLKSRAKIAGDYVYCSKCQSKLRYQAYYLGHIGQWHCSQCGFAPEKHSFEFSLKQLGNLTHIPDYQQINLSAVYLLAKKMRISEDLFWQTVASWQPSFGRGEVIKRGAYQQTIYLGKNPASWTAVLDQLDANKLKQSVLLMGLNNKVPDGHDVSWIYDAAFDLKAKPKQLIVFGDRAYDLAVRLKLAGYKADQIITDYNLFNKFLTHCQVKKQIFLANYSAMLKLRLLLTGKSLN